MNQHVHISLLDRCSLYLAELAQIHADGGGLGSKSIEDDLRRLDRWRDQLSQRQAGRAPRVGRWVDDVIAAITDLGGEAHLSEITHRVHRIRQEAMRSWTRHSEATIRDTLECHCAESENFKGRGDLFEMVNKGSGYWRLKKDCE